jgi:hypothetical protein
MRDITVSLDARRLDVDAIQAFLTTTYWSPGISREVVASAVAGSVCVGAFDGEAQVGFARLVTDRATFAYLADVYVLEPHLDAHAVYAQYGFTPLGAPERFMELHRPDVYRTPEA